MNIRFATSAISSINSGLETAAVSLSSVCSIGESYVDRDLEGLEIYIYSFRDGVPIAVFFIPGEDGAASASAVPLLSQELDTSTERRLENSLEEFFSPLDRFDVSKIDIP